MSSRPEDDLTISPSSGVTLASAASRTPLPLSHRFATGTIIAGRYRLVASLGRGGMGEVYRADDLTLDHPVALKFLAVDSAQTASDLALFHNELRTARQVSHKNVCRLYDLGEADGRRFLTMEYVDGEDLASLLRRIGRIPQDKAIELARQLCAGLAAAHERGVLHRDLKPANVMIDGDGNVRITDFGLAVATAGSVEAGLAGTPQYMAPEQLIGQPASVKTDIYALGLVLFEIFTGRRAYDAKTLTDLVQLHKSGVAPTPSSVVRDIDPAVERIVMRCLDGDPERRPASALTVAAALPGANPLAEALAAGETPSPELLVAAGEADALRVGAGLSMVALAIVGLIAFSLVQARVSLVRMVRLDKPPAVLLDRSEQILASLGYREPHADVAYGYSLSYAYLNWIARTDRSATRWAKLAAGESATLIFWYRTNPRDMLPLQVPFAVTRLDPPVRETGSHVLSLDERGRLMELRTVPPRLEPTEPPAPAPWKQLFDAAGLDASAFTIVAPRYVPTDFADALMAWEGKIDGWGDEKVRVEAAAYRGHPVSFAIVGPWVQPARAAETTADLDLVLNTIYRVVLVLLLVAAIVLARRHIRSGRGDARGAFRVAAFAFCAQLFAAIVGGHHVRDFTVEYSSLVRALEDATFFGAALWTIYLALEPYGRRFWPDMFLGWSRLLSGRIRDPRVGREVLAGVVIGIAGAFIWAARLIVPQLLGYSAPTPRLGFEVNALLGNATTLQLFLVLLLRHVGLALLITLVFVLARLVTRRPSAAVALGMFVLLYAWSSFGGAPAFWLELLLESAEVAVMTLVVIRFGLLASAVALLVNGLCVDVPLTLNVAHWSAITSNWTIGLIVSLACFGFYASRAGQPMFGNFDS